MSKEYVSEQSEKYKLAPDEKRCPICRKVFIPPDCDEWVFKRRLSNKTTVYLCSYGCTNKWDQLHPKKIAFEQRSDIIRMIRQGYRTAEIVRTLGVERSKVRYWQERVAKEVEDGPVQD